MNTERDELDAFLDAGRARYGGSALTAALDDAATWTETRTARRRRIARTWIAGGVLAGLLAGGGAIASAVVDDPEKAVIATSTVLTFASDDGATCVVELQPVVHTSAPLPWVITRNYLADLDAPTIDLPALIGGGAAAEREIANLADGLSHDAEDEILRRTGSRVEVTLLADYSCTAGPVAGDDYGVTPPVVGDDFGRKPTPQSGRAPDLVGFFRASTGQICEIQMKINPDWMNDTTDGRDAEIARAYVATIDVTTVDYSALLAETTDGTAPYTDPAQDEAAALLRTLSQLASTLGDPSGEIPLSIITEGWAFCDPEPSA